jgi:hypothetical protein
VGGLVNYKNGDWMRKTEYYRPYLPYLAKLGGGGVQYSYCMKLIRAGAIPCKML